MADQYREISKLQNRAEEISQNVTEKQSIEDVKKKGKTKGENQNV